jgi:branched-chain amino acid transport system permease protein
MNKTNYAAPASGGWTLLQKGVVSIVVAIVLLGLPLVVPGYLTFQLSGVMAYAVAAIGLNLITGYAGQISLGHNAFFALGSYTAAMSMVYFNVHYITSVFLAAIVSFVVGYLAGFPAQRLRGLYLALITLVLAVSVAPIIKHFKDVTGGMPGLSIDRPTPPAWTGLTKDAWIYYLVLTFTVVCFYLARNFVAGSTGRALTAVRLAPLAASSMGVNVNGYKVLIFGLGSMMGGIGGALFNYSIGFVGPDSYSLMLSVGFLAAIVVGGLGTIWGALVAGLFLQFVPTYASDISEALAGTVYGGILIACMFFMPRGIVGTWIEKRQQRHRPAAKV